jgi:hypothetical protein
MGLLKIKKLKIVRLILFLTFFTILSSCKKDEVPIPSRTYYMGFQNSAPRYDNIDIVLQALSLWTPRADAAMITTEVPWKKLLAGTTVNDYVVSEYKGLVDYYRSLDLKLWIYIDPQNGLDRTSDAVELKAVNKSIADVDMQLLYQKFVMAMDSILLPDHLGLALETNLIHAAASSSIYQGVKLAANNTAAAVRLRNATVPLSISVQAETAWNKFSGGSYVGIAKDFADFPFIDELGISSYPYFGFDSPHDIPLNYYSRLIEGKNIPVFVTEGGWPSESLTTADQSFVSSQEKQQDYFNHHGQLLDNVKAAAVFQLPFTDIDTNYLPADVPENIIYFTSLGLVDVTLQPKLALAAWDNLFNRKLIE